MPAIARIGDRITGICDHGQDCCPHIIDGEIAAGANSVNAESSAVARIGDRVTHNCPHSHEGTVIEGSGSVNAESTGVSRIGDRVDPGGPSGEAQIVEGASAVNAGD